MARNAGAPPLVQAGSQPCLKLLAGDEGGERRIGKRIAQILDKRREGIQRFQLGKALVGPRGSVSMMPGLNHK